MERSHDIDEEQIGALLRALPAAPAAWIQAAAELPRTRAELGDVIGRIESDAGFAAAVESDIAEALRLSGLTDDPARRAALRARLDPDS